MSDWSNQGIFYITADCGRKFQHGNFRIGSRSANHVTVTFVA